MRLFCWSFSRWLDIFPSNWTCENWINRLLPPEKDDFGFSCSVNNRIGPKFQNAFYAFADETAGFFFSLFFLYVCVVGAQAGKKKKKKKTAQAIHEYGKRCFAQLSRARTPQNPVQFIADVFIWYFLESIQPSDPLCTTWMLYCIFSMLVCIVHFRAGS